MSRVPHSSPNLFTFACVRGVCLHHRHDGHWCRPTPTRPCTVAKSLTSTGSTGCWAGAYVVITVWLKAILRAVTSQLIIQVYDHLHSSFSSSACCVALGKLCKSTPNPVTAHCPCAGPHTSWVTANFWTSRVLHCAHTYFTTAQPAQQLQFAWMAPRKTVHIVLKSFESTSRHTKFCKILILQTGCCDTWIESQTQDKRKSCIPVSFMQ